MNVLYKYACVFVCALMCYTGLHAAASPVPMLQGIAQNIIKTLDDNQAQLHNNPSIIQGAVERNLLPHVDVVGMSRSVLGRQAWNKASASERQAFSKAFTQLVIRTYSAPLAEYNHETIQFSPIRGVVAGRFVKVRSVITRKEGKTIPLVYSLVNVHGQWKIYDLSVEGVSLLMSFRQQFSSALRTSTIGQLTAQLNKKQITS